MIDVATGLVDLARPPAELLRSLTENHWWVGFGDQERSDDPQNSSKDGHYALYPSPTNGLADESTNDWAQNGTHKGSRCEERHGQTALLCAEHISNHTTGVGQRRRTDSAGEESHDDQRPDVLRSSRACVESSESSVRSDE